MLLARGEPATVLDNMTLGIKQAGRLAIESPGPLHSFRFVDAVVGSARVDVACTSHRDAVQPLRAFCWVLLLISQTIRCRGLGMRLRQSHSEVSCGLSTGRWRLASTLELDTALESTRNAPTENVLLKLAKEQA